MSSFIVKLFNISSKENSIDPMQIDKSASVSSLTHLLNTISQTTTTYLFYYNSERINDNLESIIEKYKLNSEEIIEIGYVDEKDIQSDFVIDCNDTVIGLTYYNGELYYLEFNGEVYSQNKEFRYTSNKIRGIFSGSRLYGYSDYSIFDLIDNIEIFRFDQKLRGCSASKNDPETIVASTSTNIYCIDLKNLLPLELINKRVLNLNNLNKKDTLPNENFVIITKNIPKCVYLVDKIIYWIEGYNNVILYDMLNQRTRTFSSNYAINRLLPYSNMIFASTAHKRIIKFGGAETEEFETFSRFSNHLICQGSNIIYSTQHEVIFLSSQTMNEVRFYRSQGQINCLEVSDTLLFIANDQKIDVLKL